MRGPNGLVVAGALLTLLTTSGCDPVRGLADAGGTDDDADAAPGDPDAAVVPPGEATVLVLDERAEPIDGALVLFHDPRGSLYEQVFTGSDGIVSAVVEANAFVTVIQSNSDDDGVYHRLQTLHGVMPGDAIEIGPKVPEPSWNDLGTLQVMLGAPFSGATDYEVQLGCNRYWTDSIGSLLEFGITEDECIQGATQLDVLFTARDLDGKPIAFSVAPNIELDTPITSPSWQTSWRSVSVRASNAPADMLLIRSGLSIVHRNLDYGLGDPEGKPVGIGQGAVFDMQVPQGFAMSLQGRLTGLFSDSTVANSDGITMIVRNTAATATELAVDLTADLLPRVHQVELHKGADEWSVDFVVQGGMPDVSAVAAGLKWYDTSSAKPAEWEWTVVANPQLGLPIRLPQIPDGAVVHPDEGGNHWPPPDGAEVTGLAAGLADLPAGAWPFFHENRAFDFFDHPLPLNAPAGTQARMSIGGTIELEN